MSHRREQIESTLHRAVSQVLVRDLSDPRIRGLVSVTRVKLSEDMRDLRVWVSVLPAKFGPRSVSGLRAAAAHVHRHVCALVDLRFELDKELEKQESIYDAINRGLDREGISSSDVKHVLDPQPAQTDDDLDGDDADYEDGLTDEADAGVEQDDDETESEGGASDGGKTKSKADRGRRHRRGVEEDEAEAHA